MDDAKRPSVRAAAPGRRTSTRDRRALASAPRRGWRARAGTETRRRRLRGWKTKEKRGGSRVRDGTRLRGSLRPADVHHDDGHEAGEEHRRRGADDVAAMLVEIRVLRRWSARRLPIEERQVGGPAGGQEKHDGEQPAPDLRVFQSLARSSTRYFSGTGPGSRSHSRRKASKASACSMVTYSRARVARRIAACSPDAAL
jgi:hypothetical protein